MAYLTKNYSDKGGDRTVINGEIVINGTFSVGDDATVPLITSVATATVLGGVKAAEKGVGETVEAKIDGTSKKLFVPTYPVLPIEATSEVAGIVKQAENQVASTASTVAGAVADLNALIAKLKASGIMIADA